MAFAVRATDLGKRFAHRDRDAPHTFREFVEGGWRNRRTTAFWALREIGFEIRPGEMLGLIGHNGSGKSTLLRLIGGVMRPDEGRVETASLVHGLLDLNTGMHPDLSGRDNVFICGVLSGLTLAEVRERFDSIVAFAELEEHIEEPFRGYSSGMKLRLGFAIAVHVEPRILLIDEVLTVGDLAFQKKCLQRITEIRDGGCAIVLISHDLSQIRTHCDRVLWLHAGTQVMLGEPGEVVDAYQTAMARRTMQLTDLSRADERTAYGTLLRMGENRFGTLEAEISSVELHGTDVGGSTVILPGAPLTVRVGVRVASPPLAMHVSVAILDVGGAPCFESNSDIDGAPLPSFGGETSSVDLRFDRLDLKPGDYTISVGLWRTDWEGAYDFHAGAYPIKIAGSPHGEGPLLPPRTWLVGPASRRG